MNKLLIRDFHDCHARLVNPPDEARPAGDDQLMALGHIPNRSLTAPQVSTDQTHQARGEIERARWIANGSR